MLLKNYTSNVPVNKTLFRIQQVLGDCGVAHVTISYAPNASGAGEPDAMSFKIETPTGTLSVRLPVNVNHAQEVLWMDYVGKDKLGQNREYVLNSHKRRKRSDFREQAQRTAWKILQDWVEVQMSMIKLKQADPMQIFLPYVVTNDGTTVYARLTENRNGARAAVGLLPASTEEWP